MYYYLRRTHRGHQMCLFECFHTIVTMIYNIVKLFFHKLKPNGYGVYHITATMPARSQPAACIFILFSYFSNHLYITSNCLDFSFPFLTIFHALRLQLIQYMDIIIFSYQIVISGFFKLVGLQDIRYSIPMYPQVTAKVHLVGNHWFRSQFKHTYHPPLSNINPNRVLTYTYCTKWPTICI